MTNALKINGTGRGTVKTVYVLGAGASKHVRYPLIGTMGAEMLLWMSRNERFVHTREFIRSTFGEAPNVEDVITELEQRVESLANSEEPTDSVERTRLGNVLGEIRTAIPLWFREIRNNTARDYARFAESIVQPGDVVITFNYDDSLERELKRVGKWDIWRGYGFEIGSSGRDTQVPVLKLHGSINWLNAIFGGATTGPFTVGSGGSLGQCPCLPTDDLKFLGYPDMSGTFPGGGGFPSLILPGRNKKFWYETSFGNEHEEFFHSLWMQAVGALRSADRVVICGYGLQAVDQRACGLLLETPNKKTVIVVVSGDQGRRISDTFRSAGFPNVSCHENGYFENWIEENVGRSVSAG
jgi:hypothetical protein